MRPTPTGEPPLLFALAATRDFGEAVAQALGTSLAPVEERGFEDGEHKTRSLTSVRGRDAFVIQSLHGGPDDSPNDKLCRLLFFLATLRDLGAASVTAVVPYLAYARKDRRTKPHDPVTSRYLAQLFETVGCDTVVTLEVHNIAAFENGFRCRAVHLDARTLFASRLVPMLEGENVVVASPDPGGVKRAQLFRERLEHLLGRAVGFAFMEKRRSEGMVSGTLLAGDVESATVVVVDDLISSGGTTRRAAEACLAHGAGRVLAVATHGLFTTGAAEAIRAASLAKVFVTDTVPPFRLPPDLLGADVVIVPAAPLFAEAIRRLHTGGSITELLEEPQA
ncbi:MAG: ribose-phosphate pyrophosphokinase [Acetobacteraceae bacterium]|jgi:ribose-phosphate pyrophosphokinase|nr:ribose-phosphate pyrophosphokinase [Acetobacteraceae bacterium]